MKETDDSNNEYFIRRFLEETSVKFIEGYEDGDETFFRFWEENGLKIRSCLECGGSQCKSPNDGIWIVYWTTEHQLWLCNELKKENSRIVCSLCEKWFYRFRNRLDEDEEK